MECIKLNKEFTKLEQDNEHKIKALEEALAKQKELMVGLNSMKLSFIGTKYVLWNRLALELKRLKDYFAQVEDDKELANSCLT